MIKFLGQYAEYGYALLRTVAGFLFACHGAQKLFGLLGGQPEAGALGTTASMIQFFGGILIALGLVTSFAAIIAASEMAVAYFRVHAPHGFFPIQNSGELPVLFCFVFLYVALRGGGSISMDNLFQRHKAEL